VQLETNLYDPKTYLNGIPHEDWVAEQSAIASYLNGFAKLDLIYQTRKQHLFLLVSPKNKKRTHDADRIEVGVKRPGNHFSSDLRNLVRVR